MEFIGSDNLSIDSRRFCNRFTEGVERALVRDRALVVGLPEGPPVLTVLTDFSSVYIYAVYLVIVYVLYKLYRIFFVPLNRIRYLGDIGYASEGNIKDTVNRVRKQRIVGDIPPVYPNGWFGLMEGFKLQTGNVLNITALGKELQRYFIDAAYYNH